MTLRVLFLAPGKDPELRQIGNGYQELQALLGGEFELAPESYVGPLPGQGIATYWLELPDTNAAVSVILGDEEIQGPVVFVGLGSRGESRSLTDEQVSTIAAWLTTIERPLDVEQRANLLITEVEAALGRGTIHREPGTGRQLTTVKEILQCMRDHGSVEIESATQQDTEGVVCAVCGRPECEGDCEDMTLDEPMISLAKVREVLDRETAVVSPQDVPLLMKALHEAAGIELPQALVDELAKLDDQDTP